MRRAQNVHWQSIDVSREARADIKGQKAGVLWFTGLSGAGKSTIANFVEKRLHSLGRHTVLLDGDNIRHGLSRALINFDPTMRPVLKSGGFLTRDDREVERKKDGRATARRSFQFSKR